MTLDRGQWIMDNGQLYITREHHEADIARLQATLDDVYASLELLAHAVLHLHGECPDHHTESAVRS
jgi:hypothetical protein